MGLHVTATSELHFGTYAMASCVLLPGNFRRVADIIYRALTIAKELSRIKDAEVTAESSKSSLAGRESFRGDKRDFCEPKILELRQEAKEWVCTFSVPWE